MADRTRTITLRVQDDFSRQLNQYVNQMHAADTATDSFGKKAGRGFMQTVQSLRDLGLAAMTVKGSFDAVYGTVSQFATIGTTARRNEAALRALTGSSAEYEAQVQAIIRATRQTVTESEAAAYAYQLQRFGLAETSSEMERFIRTVATVAAANPQLGSTGEAINQIQLTLSNMSFMRLDQLGISAGEVRKRIAELREETKGMSQEEAFQIAVMEELSEQADILGDEFMEIGGAQERMQTRFRGFKEWMGTHVSEALDTAFTSAEQLYTLFSELGVVDTTIKLAVELDLIESEAGAWDFVLGAMGTGLDVARGIGAVGGGTFYPDNPTIASAGAGRQQGPQENYYAPHTYIENQTIIGQTAPELDTYMSGGTKYATSMDVINRAVTSMQGVGGMGPMADLMLSPTSGFYGAFYPSGKAGFMDEDYWAMARGVANRQRQLEMSQAISAALVGTGNPNLAGGYQNLMSLQALTAGITPMSVVNQGILSGEALAGVNLAPSAGFYSAFGSSGKAAAYDQDYWAMMQGMGPRRGRRGAPGIEDINAALAGGMGPGLSERDVTRMQGMALAAERMRDALGEVQSYERLSDKFGIDASQFDTDVFREMKSALSEVGVEAETAAEAMEVYELMTGLATGSSELFEGQLQRLTEELDAGNLKADEYARKVQDLSMMDMTPIDELISGMVGEGDISGAQALIDDISQMDLSELQSFMDSLAPSEEDENPFQSIIDNAGLMTEEILAGAKTLAPGFEPEFTTINEQGTEAFEGLKGTAIGAMEEMKEYVESFHGGRFVFSVDAYVGESQIRATTVGGGGNSIPQFHEGGFTGSGTGEFMAMLRENEVVIPLNKLQGGRGGGMNIGTVIINDSGDPVKTWDMLEREARRRNRAFGQAQAGVT